MSASDKSTSDRRSPDDMRHLLQQLASDIGGQIAAVDRRQSEALKAVEARLNGFASQAEEARARVAKSAPAIGQSLSRLGEGMTDLAQEAGHQGWTDEPWDTASAEALTRIYDDGPPAVFYADPPAATVAPQAAVQAPAVVAVAPATQFTELPHAVPSDRVWLDERLADIAVRVEQALANASPDKGFAALDARLDRFESRFDQAIAGLDRQPNLDAFRDLETQLGEIRSHLDGTRRQLARLDGIEQNLQTLNTLAQNSPSDQPAPDADLLVTRISERLAAEHKTTALPDASQVAAQAQGLADLRHVLDSYMSEQRQAQGQTAGMLGTMQEALIRLIDRIEEVEADLAEGHHEPDAAEFVTVSDERAPMPGRRASDRVAAEALAEQAVAAPAPTPSTTPVADPAVQGPAAAAVAPRARRAQVTETPAAAAAREVKPAQMSPEQVRAAAEALAAERARVAAERVQAVRAPSAAKGAAERRAAPATDQANRQTRAMAPTGAGSTPAQRGLRIAGVAALLIGLSTASFLLVDRYAGRSSVRPEVPIAIAPPVAPSAEARPAVAGSDGETILVAPTAPGAKSDPAVRPVPATQRTIEPAPREAPVEQRAPEPAAPTTPRPRPMPETVTEDISQGPRPDAPSLAAAAGARPSQAAINGIVLDGAGQMPNPAELARRLTQPAGNGPQPVTIPQAQTKATPIAAKPTAAIADAPVDLDAPARPGLIEIPSAQIGPMSLRLAAQQGDPSAQFEVAARFAEAKGVKQDFQQAHIWYARAAQKGFVPAQYRLATLIERGLGGPADLARAKAWYKRAADQGHIKAMHNLAVIATTQDAQNPDYATAAKWFTEAAERGLSDSQYNLAVLHDNGLGVPRDEMQAYKWYALAARAGDKDSIKRRDQIFASLTPGQTRDAEKLVATWRSKPTELRANDPRAAANAWRNEQEQMLARANEIAIQQQALRAGQAPVQQPAAEAAPKPARVSVRPAPPAAQ